ncbi:MAG TPA: hypothetical protein VMR97_02850 [Acidimicrobiales bacterium]|nr:hypothetical protein [Acidimicrobiales bacterium]
MKRLLRRVFARIDRRFFLPLQSNLDTVGSRLQQVEARLDSVEGAVEALRRTLGEVQEAVETTMARSAASAESTMGVVESQARMKRRVEEIEQLLGGSRPLSSGDR